MLLDVSGAADYLAVSERFVRRLVAERRVPYLKLGKFVRFDTVDLDRFVLATRREALRGPLATTTVLRRGIQHR